MYIRQYGDNYRWEHIGIEDLKDKLIKKIVVIKCKDGTNDDEILFYTDTEIYHMYYQDNCCAKAYIEDITGDMSDLIDSPILVASEETNMEEGKEERDYYPGDRYMWAFYKLATFKGHVDIRWEGVDNGYYSTAISMRKIPLELYDGSRNPENLKYLQPPLDKVEVYE